MSVPTSDSQIEMSDSTQECRTCLQKIDINNAYSVFKTLDVIHIYEEKEFTIALELARIAGVKISSTDIHSKFMCQKCFTQLNMVFQFIAMVKKSDLTLQQRSEIVKTNEDWPKPIQLDKSINGDVFGTVIDVDIKQEVLSEEEYESQDAGDVRSMMLDIKVEPEEIEELPTIKVTVNGTIPLEQMGEHNALISNGCETYEDEENNFSDQIKQEPLSEEEEPVSDLPLECMLCSKSFNSVSGLKAHVIAQHSYKTVKRKTSNAPSPVKKPRLKCGICNRTFTTSTDLMVHETCHNKSKCYGCQKNFDTFAQLTKHRRYCKALRNKEVQKPKSLEDALRPQPSPPIGNPLEENKPENPYKCMICDEKFTEAYYLKIHHGVHHENTLESRDEEMIPNEDNMEVETLETLFGETDNSTESDNVNRSDLASNEDKTNKIDELKKVEDSECSNDNVEKNSESSTDVKEANLSAFKELLEDSVDSPGGCKNSEVIVHVGINVNDIEVLSEGKSELSEQVKIENIDSGNIDSENIDSGNIESENINSGNIHSENIDSENNVSENVATQ